MTQEPSFTEKVTETVVAEVNALLQKELGTDRKEIRNLKRRLNKVSSSIDDINLLGLQEQLNALSNEVKASYLSFLLQRQNIADLTMRLEVFWMIRYVIDGRTPTNTVQADRCVARLRELFSISFGSLTNSTQPESVVADFNTACRPVMVNYGFGGYYP